MRLLSVQPLQHRVQARAQQQRPMLKQARFAAETFMKNPANFLYSDRIKHAFSFTPKQHQHHARKGSLTPYLSHLLAVTSYVMEYAPIKEGTSIIEKPTGQLALEFPNGITLEDAVIAALLHDAVEDIGGEEMLKKIQTKFGDTVAKLVTYVTKVDDPAYDKLSYNEYSKLYLKQVASGPATAILISGSDKLHNLNCTLRNYWDKGDEMFKIFKGKTREEKLQYYRDVIEIYGKTGHHPRLVRDIGNTLKQLDFEIARNSKQAKSKSG